MYGDGRFVAPGYGDVVVPLSTNEAFTTGEFVKVPLLIGGNRDVSCLAFLFLVSATLFFSADAPLVMTWSCLTRNSRSS